MSPARKNPAPSTPSDDDAAPSEAPGTPESTAGGGTDGASAAETNAADRQPGLPPDIAELTYETARDQLVDVVRRLEAGQGGLEESIALWERGEMLATRCQQWLDGARERLDDAVAARGSRSEER